MKTVVYILFIIFTLTLIGCRSSYYYDDDKLIDDVEKVEIIEINYPHLENEATIIKTLNLDETNGLISELSKIKFDYPLGDPPTMDGYSIRIYYKNLEYEVIAQKGTKRYDKEGIEIAWYKRQCSKEDFDNLVLKYIE